MVKNNDNFSRPPLERMMRLHAALKARHFPNCQKIAAELEVSPKTIQRDIDFMRYRLGLPIEYHPQEFGFHYTEAGPGFADLEVFAGGTAALFGPPEALSQYKCPPFERAHPFPLRKHTRRL